MKRLGIYLIYDKDKIIDSYIDYMLGELKTCIDYLVVVCNMPEVIRGADILEKHADEIFFRENIGFDAGGFKTALCELVGWEKILQYEELLLINDSMFGPFCSMKDIFSRMDKKPVDFWGLTKHKEFIRQDKEFIAEHIQTFFLCIRFRMLQSTSFREYWERLPYYKTFGEVVWGHETKFTSYFANMGYTYEVLADTRANDSKIKFENNFSQYALLSCELIKKRNFPFLKKQQIAYNTLAQQTQENLSQAIRYIDKNTDYDVNLIWENLIRTMHMSDLQRSLCLQYIIPSAENAPKGKGSIAIVIFAEHREAAEYVLEYIDNLEAEFPVQIISENKEILEAYCSHARNKEGMSWKQRCDLASLSWYDLVCVLHDADVTSDVKPSYEGKACFYCIWENLLKDRSHILGIAEKFEQEEKLGFLAPPQPNFGDHFEELGLGWNEKYEEVKEIAGRLGLRCPVYEDYPPFRITDSFWIRGNILKCLNEIREEEEPYLPYLWICLAQHMGYYSGIVESTDYASMNEVNMQYYLKRLIGQVKSEYGNFKSFDEMGTKLSSGILKAFCKKHSRILIYGAGYYAQKYKSLLPEAEACIVSDGHKTADSFEGIPIRYLSEIRSPQECGVVICLNRKNQKQVIPFLEQYGIKNYFCISQFE